ncbi:MAG: M24 family metallopeptidase [Geminicoccaceae bacterium]
MSPPLRDIEQDRKSGADAAPDLSRLRLGRLERLRAQLKQRDLAAGVLVDPVNIRYATGARNMQVFHLRNPARYLFVPAEGPVILFEFPGCHHLAEGLETIDEIRPATTVSFAASGPRVEDKAKVWAAEIGDLVRRHGGGSRRVAIERVNWAAAAALADQGFALSDAQDPVERARAIKTPEELVCIRQSLAAVERAVAEMRAGLRPGMSENALWALLHRSIIEQDCDYVETRLLSSGPRTNPWFKEAGRRAIQNGDLVALDTDVVGRFGYYADFSRTFFCGRGRPGAAQRQLYRLAYEQVHTNIERLKPGMSFKELSEIAWPIPDAYVANRYFVLAHGVGMTGEYPYILHRHDLAASGYDGVIEPGMTLCVESYIGAEGGLEGVKLEEQVLVTESGIELLSRFPHDEALLGREA